ncbi:LysR substrate-binding domain-containing protein [Burkholderia pyrrocinia]
MDTRFLRSLVAVAETGSLAAAARKERLTAAAIGQRIQTLEQGFSSQLLIRSARSVAPSERCLKLLPTMREIIRMTDELADAMNSGALAGELRIGAISTALTGILSPAVKQLSSSAPQLRLTVSLGCSRTLYELVANNELDAAILVRPPFVIPKVLRFDVLRSEPLMLLSGWPADQSKVLALLREHRFIRYGSRTWGGQIASRYLLDHDIAPETLCEIDSLEAISVLVAQGLGVSLIPAWPGLSVGGLCPTPVPGASDYARDIVLLAKSSPHRPAALDALKMALGATVRAHG